MNKSNKTTFIDLLSCSSEKEVLELIKTWTSDRSDLNHVVRSIILDIHAQIESRLKSILYEHMSDLALKMEGHEKKYQKCLKALEKRINSMSFSQIHKLLEPCFESFGTAELDEYIPTINTLRNEATHRKPKHFRYKGRDPVTDIDCLAEIYIDSWYVHTRLGEFYERRIDDQRAMNERGWKCYFGKCSTKNNKEIDH